MPVYLAFTVFSFAYFKEELVSEKLVDLKQFSTFSKILLLMTSVTGVTSVFVLSILQVVRRHEFTKFVNFWMQKPVAQEHFQQYRTDCFKHHVTVAVVVSLNILCQYLGGAKFTLISLVSSLVIMQPSIMLYGIFGFATCFQSYVIALLADFYDDLMEFSQGAALNEVATIENYLRLSKKYQEIHDFIDQFVKCFGAQLSLITCFVTLSLISSVKLNEYFNLAVQ